ncbi:MAG: hypothetical protein E6K76_00180 [Candidatus Eisenbacteria bacterium]|uniref:Septum formation inhibitor Maf n=1 Tax=Eiseniibacteriota bacterium TaxID=2212470 RepID=A0A538TBS6_UNCEI|nr:MAG: hypothetical protein E6K76_00180 [Candidatus Eisenbacteria bacterium]
MTPRSARHVFTIALLFAGAHAPPAGASPAVSAAPLPAADPPFGSYWHDGKAELDGYRYSVTRYGQLRRGQCAAIYVTEPFSRSKRVKVDDASRNPKDTFDVLKLNLIRDFQTGIYDYNTMTSLFVRSEDFDPVKASFASMEWCGNVYEELRVDPGLVSQRLSSYFEDESTSQEVRHPKGGLMEEELFIRLRGLSGDYLRPGQAKTVPFLPSAFRRRLTHQPLRWTDARIERLAAARAVTVPAGRFICFVYSVKIQDGPEGLFFVDRAYPHRVVRWEWRQATGAGTHLSSESNDSGDLQGSTRTSYWKLHGEGDERYLRRLGLNPGGR